MSYSEFFEKHTNNIKNKNIVCEECGESLRGNTSEVCHILPKQYFKSIATEDTNIIYLCGLYSSNECHYKFDNLSNEKFKTMKVFEQASNSFEQLKNIITEKITYKHEDRYGNIG